MNSEFPPQSLPPPQFYRRRPEKPRRAPLPPELIARRGEIARILGVKVDSLSRALGTLSEDARRAVFYKLQHEQPVNLSGTGLKELIQPSRNITLVVPREGDLEKFKEKIADFGTKPLKQGHAPH